MAICYKNGEGTGKDLEMAFKYFTVSANSGYTNAYFSLGLLYENGDPIKKNYLKAKQCFKISANKDN